MPITSSWQILTYLSWLTSATPIRLEVDDVFIFWGTFCWWGFFFAHKTILVWGLWCRSTSQLKKTSTCCTFLTNFQAWSFDQDSEDEIQHHCHVIIAIIICPPWLPQPPPVILPHNLFQRMTLPQFPLMLARRRPAVIPTPLSLEKGRSSLPNRSVLQYSLATRRELSQTFNGPSAYRTVGMVNPPTHQQPLIGHQLPTHPSSLSKMKRPMRMKLNQVMISSKNTVLPFHESPQLLPMPSTPCILQNQHLMRVLLH